jgi:hypothetical protein
MQTVNRAVMQTVAAPQHNSAAATALQQVQQKLEEVAQLKERISNLEKKVAGQAPLNGLTLGAVEARLAILEEDYVERQDICEVGVPGCAM